MPDERNGLRRVRVAYFSGTGGVRLVAEQFERTFLEAGHIVELRNVRQPEEAGGRFDLLVLIYAVHACNPPQRICDYIESLPQADGAPAAVISVSGGGAMFPNTACRTLCKKRLQKKGYHTRYEDMLMMPSNCIVDTPPALTRALHEAYPKRVEAIVSDLLRQGERHTVPQLLDRFVSLAGRVELMLSRHFGRIVRVSEACNGCGRCAGACEAGNITMADDRPRFGDKCDMCFACLYACPRRAMRPGWIGFFMLKQGFGLYPLERGANEEPLDDLLKKSVWTGARRYLTGRDPGRDNRRPAYSLLRGLSLALIATIVFSVLIYMLAHINDRMAAQEAVTVTEGVADMSLMSPDGERVFSLEGAWVFYPERYCRTAEELDALDSGPRESVVLPHSSYRKAGQTGTYRLSLRVGRADEGLAIVLPFLQGRFAVYINGAPATGHSANQIAGEDRATMLSSQFTIFPLALDTGRAVQDIVISVGNGEGEMYFYRESALIGRETVLQAHTSNNFGSVLFSLGSILIFLLSGLIFMAIRPSNRFHSLLCLFDTFLGIRVLLGMKEVSAFLGRTVLHPVMVMPALGTVQVVFMLTGALFGMYFIMENSNTLFPGKIRKSVIVATICLFASLVFFPGILESSVYFAVMAGFFSANLLLIVKSLQFSYRHPTTRNIVISLHNVFAIGIVGLDLWQIGPVGLNYDILIYLYMILFVVHLFWRLLDFNGSYDKLAHLNANLESIVDERTSMLKEANAKLTSLSERDPLTGAHNRLYIDQKIKDLLEEYHRRPFPLYLCVFDLDHFKSINDRFGHDEGDSTLRDISALVRENMNDRTSFARIGGEEFVLVIRDMSRREVINYVESIRRALEAAVMQNPRRTTASFGLAACAGNAQYRALFKLADQNLYNAKYNGRNCVSVSWTQDGGHGVVTAASETHISIGSL